ncbi:MAG: hypothetical protein KAR42_04740 [candidate division Zixibacteria bacterium]|nr:hypothetical protein [candidate division Zixibacteria bacterium]
MSYEIRWSPQSLKILNKLPQNDAERILSKLDDITIYPFRYLEHYEGGEYYKLRIGKFRALIKVDGKILFIEVFDKRSRIYRK